MLLLREQYPITILCEVLGVPRSSAYYHARPGEDRPVRDALVELAGQWPTYGYRRLTAMLKRRGLVVNHKVVRRLMHELGIAGEAHERKPRTTNSEHAYPRFPNLVEGLEVTRPEQVWVADVTYIRLRKEFIYLAVIMDVFTRCIRGWHLSRSLEHGVDDRGLEEGVGGWAPGDPSFRSGGAICSDGLHRAAEIPRGGDQHGERRRTRREWICREVDENDQGGGSRPERVPGPGRRTEAVEKVP